MPTTRELTGDELLSLQKQGIDTKQFEGQKVTLATDEELAGPQQSQSQPITSGQTIGRTLKAHAGGTIGGGLGAMIAGSYLLGPEVGVPATIAGLIGTALAGAGGGYVGQKLQNTVQGSDVTQRLEQEQQEAAAQHPNVALGTDITASALASGGMPSIATPLRAGRGVVRSLIGDGLSGVDRAALSQVGEEALSPVGAKIVGERAGDVNAVKSVAMNSLINPAINSGVDLATSGQLPSGKDLIAQALGGAAFAGQSPLGKMVHEKINGTPEPIGEPTAKGEIKDTSISELNPKPEVTSPWTQKENGTYSIDDTAIKKAWSKANPRPPKPVDQYDSAGYIADAKYRNLIKTTTPDQMRQQLHDEFVANQEQMSKIAIPQGGEQVEPKGEATQKVSPVKIEIPKPVVEPVTAPVKVESPVVEPVVSKPAEQPLPAATPEQPKVEVPIESQEDLQKQLADNQNHNAPPSDFQRYTDLNTKLKEMLQSGNHNTPEFGKVWKEMEEVKNKNGGMPPVEQKTTTPPTVGEALKQIGESNHPVAEIAKALNLDKDSSSVKVEQLTDMTQNSHYNPDDDVVRLNPTAGPLTVVHEAVHAATTKKLMALPSNHPIKIELNHCMNETLVASKGKEQLYGLKNLHEFVAEALSSKEFQAHLNEIQTKTGTVWNRFVDAIRKLLGVDVKHGSMLERVLKPIDELTQMERPSETGNEKGENKYAPPKSKDEEGKLTHFLAKGTRSVIDKVTKLSDPRGKVIGDSAKQALNEKGLLIGKWKNSTIEAGEGLTKSDKVQMMKIADREVSEKKLHPEMLQNENQKKFYETVKKNLSDNGDYRLANGEPVMRGGNPTPLIKDSTYWPGMPDQKVQEVYRAGDKEAIAKFDKVFDNWNQKNLGMDAAKSAETIDAWKKSIQGSPESSNTSHQDYFNASRKQMGSPLPPEFREKDIVKNMSRYFDRQAIDNAHYKFMEKNPEVMASLGATKDAWGKGITPNGESLAHNPDVKNLLESFRGESHGPADLNERSTSSALTSLVIASPALQGHVLISNQVKAASMADNPYQMTRALAHAVANVKEGYQHAKENGAVRLTASSVSDMLDGSLSWSERLTGFQKGVRSLSTIGDLTTKLNAGLLQSYFEYLVPSKLSRANSGDSTAQAFLKRLDPTFEVGKKYDLKQQQQLASLAMEYTHGTGDIRSMPGWMLKDNEVSGFFKLAHWGVAQTNNFMHDVWNPAVKGNYTPLIMSVFGSVAGGYIIKELREALSGKKSQIPSLQEISASDRGLKGNAGLLAYNAIAAMQYSGFGGLFSQIAKYPFDFVYKNKPQGVIFPMDEVVSDIGETLKDVSSTIANDPQVNWLELSMAVANHVMSSNIQMARMAINQGIDHGLITGLPAEKKMLADKLGQLRRFDEVEGLPYNEQEGNNANPFINLEQKKFKMEQDPQKAMEQLPSLISHIMDKYSANPDVMMSKLQSLKQNSYATFPSMETTPLSFMKYLGYLQKMEGPEQAQAALGDFMKHKMVNEAKGSVVP